MSAEGVKKLCETLKSITSLKALYLWGFDALFLMRTETKMTREEWNDRQPDW